MLVEQSMLLAKMTERVVETKVQANEVVIREPIKETVVKEVQKTAAEVKVDLEPLKKEIAELRNAISNQQVFVVREDIARALKEYEKQNRRVKLI